MTSERLSCGVTFESAEQACGAAMIGGPVALAYARFDIATQEAVCAEYLTSIEAFRAGAGYEIPGEFVITSGVTLA